MYILNGYLVFNTTFTVFVGNFLQNFSKTSSDGFSRSRGNIGIKVNYVADQVSIYRHTTKFHQNQTCIFKARYKQKRKSLVK